MPPLFAPAPATTSSAASTVVDVPVERHELVHDLRVGVLRGVRADLAEALGEPRELGGNTGNVADLDVVRVQLGGRVEQQRADLVGGLPALVVLVEEPVHEELQLEVAEAVVVEGLLHLPQAPRLEHVLEVGVPDPEPAEADLARLGAAVGPVEEAPLASDVHFDRPGNGPVQPEQLDVDAHVHSSRSSVRDTLKGAARLSRRCSDYWNEPFRMGACGLTATTTASCGSLRRTFGRRPRSGATSPGSSASAGMRSRTTTTCGGGLSTTSPGSGRRSGSSST